MLNYLYGTAWKEELTSDCVYNAIKLGYRGIDTANQRKHYNEPGVGEALLRAYKDLSISREDLYLQSKFTYAMGQDHRKPYNPEDPYKVQVRSSFESTLKNLHTDYLDSYILHGPFSGSGITEEDKEVWTAMEKLVTDGLVKSIGVSNVSAEQLKQLYDFATIKPKSAQIRTFAIRKWEKDTRDFCTEHGITFQGFSLLTANRQFIGADYIDLDTQNIPKLDFEKGLNSNKDFSDILVRTGKKPAQVIFKFCHQLGILPITGTRTEENMALNLDINDFTLSNEEVSTIENIAL